jgi:hypothetical protein
VIGCIWYEGDIEMQRTETERVVLLGEVDPPPQGRMEDHEDDD